MRLLQKRPYCIISDLEADSNCAYMCALARRSLSGCYELSRVLKIWERESRRCTYTIEFKTTEFKEFGCRFTEINEFFSKFHYVTMTKVAKCRIIVRFSC